jgi:hypothetical protein
MRKSFASKGRGTHLGPTRAHRPLRHNLRHAVTSIFASKSRPQPSHTLTSRIKQVRILLKRTETKMLMIDEFQHFVYKGVVMQHVADWLKILVDDLQCALVVAGLPSCQGVIDQNEQLAGRFWAPIQMSRFCWDILDDRREFKAILRTFQEALQVNYDLPSFQADELAFRWYCASGGLIGYLTKILRLVVAEAIADKRNQITLADLDRAHVRAVWTTPLPDAPRPFREDFRPVPTPELIHRVSLVGTAAEPGSKPTRTRHKGSVSATELLVTR